MEDRGIARKGRNESCGLRDRTEHEPAHDAEMEISGRKPSGQSLKLLNLIERMGLEAVILVQGTGRIRLPLASICSG